MKLYNSLKNVQTYILFFMRYILSIWLRIGLLVRTIFNFTWNLLLSLFYKLPFFGKIIKNRTHFIHKKHSKIFDISWVAGGLLIATIIILKTFIADDPASASWWSGDWAYRKPVTVTLATGSTTDYQVKIPLSTLGIDGTANDLTTLGKVNADCSDLRFTNRNGNVLSYWLEDISATDDNEANSCSSSGNVWVKIPSVKSGDNTVYFYYGNASAASESNPDEVFIHFDKFATSSTDTAKWTATGSPTYSSSAGTVALDNGEVLVSANAVTTSGGVARIIARAKQAATTLVGGKIGFSNTAGGGTHYNTDDAAALTVGSTEEQIASTASTNLVSHYKLEETTSTDANQFKASGYHDTGKLSQAVSMYGNAAGTESSILSFNRGSQISGNNYERLNTNQGTISFWFKPSWDGNPATRKRFFGSSSGGGQAVIEVLTGGTLRVLFWDTTGGAYREANISGTNWSSSNWYHVVTRWDADNVVSGSSRIVISLNGVNSTNGYTSNMTLETPGNLNYICSSVYPCDALIDDFAIYDRVLTTAEISTLYQGGTGSTADAVADSALKFYAKLDGTGTLQPVTYNAGASASKMQASSSELTGGINLVADGDMEDAGTTSWPKHSGDTITKISSSVAYDTQIIEAKSTVGAAGMAIQDFTTVSGSDYTVSGWMKNGTTSNPQILIDSPVFTRVVTYAPGSLTTWTHFNFSFKAASTTTRIYLREGNGNGGTALFDNITITPNSIDNGGMEGTYSGGLAPGWGENDTGGTLTPAEEGTIVHSGSKSQKVTTSGGSYWPSVYQTKTGLDPNTWYMASGWARVDSGIGSLRLVAGDPWEAYCSSSGNITADSTWHRYSFICKPSSGGKLTVEFETNASAVTAYIDDVSVTPLSNVATSFKAWTPVDDSSSNANDLSVHGDSDGVASNATGARGNAYTFDGSTGYLRQKTYDVNVGSLSYSTNDIVDSGQTFEDWDNDDAGEAEYMVVVTNSDNTTSWGYLCTNITSPTTQSTVYTKKDCSTGANGFNGTSPSGKTPVGYEVRKTDYQITGDLTAGAWVKNVGRIGTDVIISKMSYSGGFVDTMFHLKINSTSGYPEFLVSSTGSNTHASIDNNAIDTEWHYLVGVFNSSEGKTYLYKDGVLVDSDVHGISAIHDSALQLTIGKGTNTDDFSGSIDSPFVLDSALSADQIKDIYNSTASHYGLTTNNEGVNGVDSSGSPQNDVNFNTYAVDYNGTTAALSQNSTQFSTSSSNTPDESMYARLQNADVTNALTFDWVAVAKQSATAPVIEVAEAEQVASGAPVAYWPLTKDTYDSSTKSLKDLQNTADSGTPPVLHMTFDEGRISSNQCPDGSVADVCDVSGNGNNGTAGATTASSTDDPTVSSTSKTGPYSLSYDGGDYVNIANNTTDFDFASSNQLTISGWINTGAAGWHTIVGKSDGSSNTADKLTLRLSTGGYPVFAVGYSALTSTTSVNDNEWHYLSAVYDAGAGYLYIDGVQDTTGDLNSLLTSTYGFAIGAFDDLTSPYYGYIDEVKIYNYARTPEQIKADYNNTKAYFGSAGAAPSYIGIVPGTGTIPNQSVLQFDGVDDYLLTNNTISSVKSVSLWVRPTSTTQSIIDFDGGTHYISASSGVVSATGFSSPTIYVNGVANGTITANQWNNIIVTTGTSFDATATTFGKQASNYFNGSIAGVKIFNYALSADQVKSQYNSGIFGGGEGVTASFGDNTPHNSLNDGLVGHWKLDGDANDSSGNGNNGTLNGDTTFTQGKLGQAGSFDGSGDYVDFTRITSMDDTNTWTAGAWVKTSDTGVGSSNRIQFPVVGDSNGTLLVLGLGIDNGKITMLRYDGAWNKESGTTSVADGNWHYLSWSNDGKSKVTMYIDGNVEKSNVNSTVNAGSVLSIGAVSSGTANGSIDDVRIYNRALSAVEIENLYRSTANEVVNGTDAIVNTATDNTFNGTDSIQRDTTVTAGLVGWWAMDEASGSYAYDRSGNGNTGTATGTTVVTGKLGRGRDFNGTSDYISGISPSVSSGPVFSASGYINPGTSGSHQLIWGPNSMGADQWISYDSTNKRLLVEITELADTNNRARYSTDNSVPLGVWTHFVVTIENLEIKIYINGSIDSEYTETIDIGDWSGGWDLGRRSTGAFYYTGLMDDMRIYNRALSPSEIQTIYAEGQKAITGSVSVSADVKPDSGSASGMTGGIGGAIAGKGENYQLSAVRHPELGSGSSSGVRSSFTTNSITTQLSGTSINDVYFYDTTLDTDYGTGKSTDPLVWRFDSSKSWYSETIDATYAACNVATNDRCGTKYFPEKSYIVATVGNLFIFDAEENKMWMRFDGYQYNAYTNANTTTGIYALNGKVYIGHQASGYVSSGLHIFNFQGDTINGSSAHGTAYDGLFSGGGFTNRNVNNAGNWSGTRQYTLVNYYANDVHAAVINGKTYVAVATDGGVSVINETDGSVVDITTDRGIGWENRQIFLTSEGDLYTDLSAQIVDRANIHAFYNIQDLASDTTFASADYEYENSAYQVTALAPNGDGIADIYITEGTSTIDSTSNTIYWAMSSETGVTVLQEKQGDESNGSVKYFTKDYISEEMVGDIRGMWPLYGTNGASIANNTYNIDDVSVKSSELTAKNANGTGLSYVDGVRGTAINFDGVDDYLCTDTNDDGTCDDDTDLDITGNLTVGAWVKADDTTSVGIINKFNRDTNNRSYLLYIGSNSKGRFYVSPNGTSETSLDTAETLVVGSWYYMVGVYDGSNIKIYLNGSLSNTTAYSSGIFNSNEPVNIGTGFYETGSYLSKFDGTIDEPFVTAEALSADQIKHMYDVGYAALQSSGQGINKLNGSSNQVNAVAASGMYTYEDSSNIQHPTSSILMAGTEGGGISKIDLSSDTLINAFSTGTPWAINHANVNALTPTTGGNFIAGLDSGVSRLNDVSGTSNLSTTNYTKVVGEYNKGTGYYYLYEDGKLVAKTNVGTSHTPVTDTNDFMIGAASVSTLLAPSIPLSSSGSTRGSIYNYFYGDIKNAEVHASALDARTISYAANNGIDPVLDLSFDEGQGTVAHNSQWESVGTTTNLVTNPSAEETAGNYASSWGDTLSASSTVSIIGNKSIKVLSDGVTSGVGSRRFLSSDSITLVPGVSYTYSAWIYNPSVLGMSGAVSLRIWGDAGLGSVWTGLVTADSTSITDEWVKLSVTYVHDSVNSDIKLGVWSDTASQDSGDAFYFDGVQFEESSSATPYCDGSLSGNGTYAWNGTAHASTSTCTYGTDGTVYGATWQKDGAKNGSLSFDGTDDYVEVKDYSDFNFGNTGDFSLSAWVKTTSNTKYILYKKQDSVGYHMYVNPSGLFQCDIHETPNEVYKNSTTAINDGSWHFVGCTFARNGDVRVYVDGVLENSGSLSTIGDINNSSDISIGKATTGGYIDGSIDEVKIYPYALTSTEIKNLYNAGGGSTALGTPSGPDDTTPALSFGASNEYCVPGDSTSCAAPVAEWKFDENQGSTAMDTSGNENNGAISGATWNDAGCKEGSCLSFDGVSGYLNVPVVSVSTNAISISAWVKPVDVTTNTYYQIYRQQGSGGISWLLSFQDNGTVLSFGLNTTVGGYTELDMPITPSNYTDGNWHHIEAVYDGTTKKIYKDGVQYSTTESKTGNVSVTSTYSCIGASSGAASSCYLEFFNGQIDSVRIYDYARTPAQVAWDYNKGAPVAHYQFDECEGTTAYDASGNGNNGTITVGATGTQTSAGNCESGDTTDAWNNGASGAPGSSSGSTGGSISFDGTDDYVDINDADSIDFSATDAFSFFAWVKPGDVGRGLIIGDYAYSPLGAINMEIDDRDVPGENTFRIYLQDTNVLVKEYTLRRNYQVGTWYLLGFTYDNNTLRLYENGEYYTPTIDTNNTLTGGLNNTSGNYKIGKDNRGVPGDTMFNGQIDDVRIYNYALTAEQVKTLYNGNSAIRFE